MSKSIITAALITIALPLAAQTNLVPNGGFDQEDKRIRKGEEALERLEHWFSPDEENIADVYSKNAKDDWGVPENKMGYQTALSEPNYAGARFFGKGRMPRHYLQVKLNDKLVEGKEYCVSFNIVLSKISRYASNNIGAYISQRKVRMREIEEYTIRPQIMHSENPIFEDQYMWSTICGTYKAEGRESYLTIGNFADEGNMSRSDYNSMRRVKGYNQMQTNDAYYFVDDVSVYNMDEIEGCSCEEEEDDDGGMQVVHSENVSDEAEMEAIDELKTKKIFFDYNSDTPKSPRIIIDVIRVMKENEGLRIKIVGHSDSKEEEELDKDISKDRAQSIADYLIDKGIDESQIVVEGRKAEEPADDTGTKSGRAKNRRVTFEGL